MFHRLVVEKNKDSKIKQVLISLKFYLLVAFYTFVFKGIKFSLYLSLFCKLNINFNKSLNPPLFLYSLYLFRISKFLF